MHKSTLLVVLLSGLVVGCVTSQTDGSTVDTMAEGGVTPPFDMSGYAVDQGTTIVVEAKNQVYGVWQEIGRADADGPKLGDQLHQWRIPGLFLGGQFLKDEGDHASADLRARYGTSPEAHKLLTYTQAGMQCMTSSVLNGTDPVDAGATCATGNTLDLSWDYDGTVNVDNDSLNCTEVRKVFALEDEGSHRYASRLTPPSYPFEVRQLRYHLVGGPEPGNPNDDCRIGLTHRVEVFVSSSATPPASPTIARSFTRTSNAQHQRENVELVDLSNPIVLTQGQHLFVALEMIYTDGSGHKLCVPSCSISSSQALNQRTWWSNAASAPYSWAELGTFGIFARPRIGMSGVEL